MNLLTERQEALLQSERRLLSEVRAALGRVGLSPDDERTLAESIEQLDDFFLLVVAGEFNAGKSALINALIGQPILKEGVTPTTTQVNILRYGEQSERRVLSDHLLEITAPVEVLRELSVVDTPGTNAIIREHEIITERFLPRADLVLFVTSTDRPFSESERVFLQKIRAWGKKVVIVLNKIDLLDNEADRAQVLDFIREHAPALLGIAPDVFPISARLALQAKQGQPQLWNASGFEALENFIRQTLDARERLRLKFLNPLGVAARLVDDQIRLLEDHKALLDDDLHMLDDVERQLAEYQRDLQRDFEFRMADIENVLLEMEQRGTHYFEETIRLGRVFDLFNKERIQREFETQVVADVPQQIERKVDELIDWLVEADLRQWQAVNEHVAERRRQHADRIVGAEQATFHYNRERLMEGLGRQARRAVENYDREREARTLAEGTQAAVAAAAAMQVGAIGLGAIVTTIATTLAADVTGILMAGLVAVLGLFVIPARRKQALGTMHRKVGAVREMLSHTLRQQFERELQLSMNRIREAIAPYARFVRAEHGKLQSSLDELRHLQAELTRLRAEIETQL